MDSTKYIFKNSLSSAVIIFSKYFLIALLPFITILISSPHNIAAWGWAAWRSLAILAAVTALSLIMAGSYRLIVTVSDGRITNVEGANGIVIKSSIRCDMDKISCISRKMGILTALSGAVTVNIIPLCKSNRPIYTIRLKQKDIARFKRLIYSDMSAQPPNALKRTEYKTGFADIIYHSLITSDSIGGLFIVILTINYIEKLFGRKTAADLLGAVDTLAHRLLSFVPYAFGLIFVLLALGWIVSFIRNFTRSCNTASVLSNGMTIRHGLIFKKHIYAPRDCMSGICIRLSLTGALFRMYDVYAILPHITKNEHRLFAGIYRNKSRFLPDYFKSGKNACIPVPYMWYKFIMTPLFILAGLLAILLPSCSMRREDIAFFILPMLPVLLILIHWLVVSVEEYRLCYLCEDGGFYKGVCRKGLSIIYVCIPVEKSAIIITQSIFQQRDKSCNVQLVLPQKGNIFKIRNLSFEKLSTFSTDFST